MCSCCMEYETLRSKVGHFDVHLHTNTQDVWGFIFLFLLFFAYLLKQMEQLESAQGFSESLP